MLRDAVENRAERDIVHATCIGDFGERMTGFRERSTIIGRRLGTSAVEMKSAEIEFRGKIEMAVKTQSAVIALRNALDKVKHVAPRCSRMA